MHSEGKYAPNRFVLSYLPKKFTIRQMQDLYEAISGGNDG